MEKPTRRFPWYLIYTPIVTAIISIWYWSAEVGDISMDVFEKILNWLEINERAVTSIVIICFAAIAVGYIIIRWFSTSVRLKNIENVANSAPADISAHIDTASQAVCNSIQADKVVLVENLATIRATTDAMSQQINSIAAQRADVPVQQGQLVAGISSLYALHDKQAQTILDLTHKIHILEEKNAKLTVRLKKAERQLRQYDQDTPEWPN